MRPAAVLLFAAGALSAQVARAPAPPAPSGAIHGTVTDAATGRPLSDVGIGISRTAIISGGTMIQVVGNVTTNGNGRYVVPAVGIGDVVVGARSPEYLSAGRRVQVDADVDLAVDFSLAPNPRISGRVLDQDKQPVTALVYLIATAYRSGLPYHLRVGPKAADDDGRFEFEAGITPGQWYSLLAVPTTSAEASDKAHEPVLVPTYYGGANSFGAARAISLQPGAG